MKITLEAKRRTALNLIEKVYGLDPKAGEYLMESFESVPPGKCTGRRGYTFQNNLNLTFNWYCNETGTYNWSSLDAAIGVLPWST